MVTSGSKQEGQVKDFSIVWVTVRNLSMGEVAKLGPKTLETR